MNDKIIFSGVQPSGDLHIGAYLGALRQWVERQDEGENYFCIVDLHAITVPQDSKLLKERTRQIAAMYIACGIEPDKSVLFVQSQNPDHTQLAWILNCFTPIGWAKKMTQFKEKSEKQKDFVSVGLFDYPVLMAADILLYNTNEVPVGEDQKQHVELARDIAKSFNAKYSQEIFILPEAKVEKIGARIMDLQNPLKKMSKSDESRMGVIFMLDKPERIREKIKKAVTDSGREVKAGVERPALTNLLIIYSLISSKKITKIEDEYTDKGYADFKSDLAELVINFLMPIQKRYYEIISDKKYLDKILNNGLEKAKKISSKNLRKVLDVVGLG